MQTEPSLPSFLKQIMQSTSINLGQSVSAISITKVIAKIVANRLSKVMAKIIFPNQRAFVHGICIAENMVVAHELIHKIKKLRGRKGLILMKRDLKKAFDRLKWSFLKAVLKAIGFNENF